MTGTTPQPEVEGSPHDGRPTFVLVDGAERGRAGRRRSCMRGGTPISETTGTMNSDVIIGHDGKPRCAWAGTGDTAFGRYHDEVWGTRTYDEPAMFEALTLGVFEVGLSWSIVFGKRVAFRTAFRGFDVAGVAAMTELDVDRLTEDVSIIRNRGKIQATVDNARAMTSASPNLVALAKFHEVTRKRTPRSVADLPKA